MKQNNKNKNNLRYFTKIIFNIGIILYIINSVIALNEYNNYTENSSNISEIIFTEIMFNPQGSDTSNEWIEIYSNKCINISEYKFYEENVNHKITPYLDTEEILCGIGIISTNPQNLLSNYFKNTSFWYNNSNQKNSEVNFTIYKSSFSLKNDGEELGLTKNYEFLDYINYSTLIPLLNITEGYSIEYKSYWSKSELQGGSFGIFTFKPLDFIENNIENNLTNSSPENSSLENINLENSTGEIISNNTVDNNVINNTVSNNTLDNNTSNNNINNSINLNINYTQNISSDILDNISNNYTLSNMSNMSENLSNISTNSTINNTIIFNNTITNITQNITSNITKNNSCVLTFNIIINNISIHEIFENEKQIKFKNDIKLYENNSNKTISDNNLYYIIEYYVEDLFGNVVKNKVITTNQDYKSFTPKINEKDEILLIKSKIIILNYSGNVNCTYQNITSEKILIIKNNLFEQGSSAQENNNQNTNKNTCDEKIAEKCVCNFGKTGNTSTYNLITPQLKIIDICSMANNKTKEIKNLTIKSEINEKTTYTKSDSTNIIEPNISKKDVKDSLITGATIYKSQIIENKIIATITLVIIIFSYLLILGYKYYKKHNKTKHTS